MLINQLKTWFKTRLQPNTWSLIISLLAAYYTFPDYFFSGIVSIKDYSQDWFTLDPSWNLALSKITQTNLRWGTDVTYSYGPLGYVSTRILFGINKYTLLLYDLFLAVNIFYFAFTVQRQESSPKIARLLLLVSFLGIPFFIGSGAAVLLFVLNVFWLRQQILNNNYTYAIFSVSTSVLLLLLKFNTGLICVLLQIATWCYLFLFKKESRKLVGITIGLFLTLFLILSNIYRVDIVPYIINGVSMVSGYHDTMFLDLHFDDELYIGATLVLFSFIYLAAIFYIKKEKPIESVLLWCIFSSSAYIIYKQGFTRADEGHIREFYTYFPILILATSDFRSERLSNSYKMVSVGLACVCLFFAKRSEKDMLATAQKRISKQNYIQSFLNHTSTSGFYIDTTINKLPNTILNKIGNNTVDAYPWNLQELYENDLNVSVRPVLQAHMALTPALTQIDADFYQSTAAPEFVLYDYVSIDNRYALMDEAPLNLILFKNYEVVDTLTSYGNFKLLLKKKKNFNKINLKEVASYDLKIGTQLFPKPNIYYKIYLNKSLKGKIKSLYHYPPELLFQVQDAANNWHEYRTSTSILQSGVFSTRYFGNTYDVYKMYGDSLKSASDSVVSYGIRPVDTTCFNTIFTVKEFTID